MTTTREEQRDVVTDAIEVARIATGETTRVSANTVEKLKSHEYAVEFVDGLLEGYERLNAMLNERDAEISRLRSTSQAGGVPAGWALVPIEPTDDMIDAFREELIVISEIGVGPTDGDEDLCHDIKGVTEGYRAMLSASPSPPGVGLRDALENIRSLAAVFDDERDQGFVAVAKIGQIACAALSASPPPPATDGDALTQQILDDAATAIKIHDGVLALKDENRRLRDALYQFEYPPDVRELREIADEIDCGKDCERGAYEWDTGAHVCSREDSAEGCAATKASALRQLADAIETRNALASVPTPTAGSKILAGLQAAAAGNLARVTIEGQTWVRADAVEVERAKWAAEFTEVSNRLRAVEKIQGMVRADEREACALVAEQEASTARSRGALDISQEYTAPLRVAAAIRSRGTDGGTNG